MRTINFSTEKVEGGGRMVDKKIVATQIWRNFFWGRWFFPQVVDKHQKSFNRHLVHLLEILPFKVKARFLRFTKFSSNSLETSGVQIMKQTLGSSGISTTKLIRPASWCCPELWFGLVYWPPFDVNSEIADEMSLGCVPDYRFLRSQCWNLVVRSNHCARWPKSGYAPTTSIFVWSLLRLSSLCKE